MEPERAMNEPPISAEALAYAKTADAAPLIERVERLEVALLEAGDTLRGYGEAIGRVGARLDRAEKHIGLPSTDV